MRRLLFTITITLFVLPVFAQDTDKRHEEMNTLLESEQYDKLIELYLNADYEYDAETSFNLGYAFLASGEMEKAIEYLTYSLEKDSTKITPLFLIGLAYSEMGEYGKAIEYMEPAIEKEWIIEDEEDPEYYAHHSLNLAELYWGTSQFDKALNLLYKAKDVLSKQSHYYNMVLFSLSTYEMENNNYDKAQPMLEELLALDNEDCFVVSKLIQLHNHNGNYDTADELKKIIYQAKKENRVHELMDDMFCIERFEHEGKEIHVFERYQEGKDSRIYDKHRFYIIDEEGESEFTIQMEYSPFAAAALEEDKNLFVLCAWKGSGHLNYGVWMEEGYSYKDLKQAVLDILNKNTNVSIESIPFDD